MTYPANHLPGDMTAPSPEMYAALTAIPAAPAPKRRWCLAAVALAASAVVFVTGIAVGGSLGGAPDAGRAAAVEATPTKAAATAPAYTTALTKVAANSPRSSSHITAWDQATSVPTNLRGPVIINLQTNTPAVAGGKVWRNHEMVKVPAGNWILSAPKTAKTPCKMVIFNLPHRDGQDSAFIAPGASQEFAFANEDLAIVLQENCVAALKPATAE